jgi:hypothetical protein
MAGREVIPPAENMSLAAAVQAGLYQRQLGNPAALEIWRDYNGRATVVCRIDELKTNWRPITRSHLEPDRVDKKDKSKVS